MMNEVCKACIFWHEAATLKAASGEHLGWCRASSPVALKIDGRIVTRWPMTKESDGCGDHMALSAD